jgi:hypothetical protein
VSGGVLSPWLLLDDDVRKGILGNSTLHSLPSPAALKWRLEALADSIDKFRYHLDGFSSRSPRSPNGSANHLAFNCEHRLGMRLDIWAALIRTTRIASLKSSEPTIYAVCPRNVLQPDAAQHRTSAEEPSDRARVRVKPRRVWRAQ